jgi:NADPH-dependent 2,4-dienoyl-CoA reductase/sulfur reductase-like enzyme
MEQLGVKILVQEEIAELVADEFGKLSEVVTTSGMRIQAALAVAAIGVRPNIGFLKGSAVETGKGILVDENLRSSVPNIYAAGDAAEPHGEAAGQHCGIAPYMNAINQGEFAAQRILEI